MKGSKIEAVLDGNTCDHCLPYHGHILPPEDARTVLDRMMQDCENLGGCRCVLVEVDVPEPAA